MNSHEETINLWPSVETVLCNSCDAPIGFWFWKKAWTVYFWCSFVLCSGVPRQGSDIACTSQPVFKRYWKRTPQKGRVRKNSRPPGKNPLFYAPTHAYIIEQGSGFCSSLCVLELQDRKVFLQSKKSLKLWHCIRTYDILCCAQRKCSKSVALWVHIIFPYSKRGSLEIASKTFWIALCPLSFCFKYFWNWSSWAMWSGINNLARLFFVLESSLPLLSYQMDGIIVELNTIEFPCLRLKCVWY